MMCRCGVAATRMMRQQMTHIERAMTNRPDVPALGVKSLTMMTILMIVLGAGVAVG